MRIAVLYTRLTGYWMANMRHSNATFGNEFLVFRNTPSPDAPFIIDSEKGITLHNIEAMSDEQLRHRIEAFSPDLIYIAGWNNKSYLQIAKEYKKKGIPVLTGMDNHWLGTWKQHLAGLAKHLLIHPYFSAIWVPGSPQLPFAKKLGFKLHQIHQGLYCADEQLFEKSPKTKKNNEIIFVGRLVNHKGVPQLIAVLEKLIAQEKLNVIFHFVGNGSLKDQLPQHKNVKRTPFVHPNDLPAIIHNAGFFILPSTYEAWGVVVQEALLAATPVISTYQCGAAKDLVTHEESGFLFDATDFSSLITIIDTVDTMSNEQYAKMSQAALEAGKKMTMDNWANTIEKIGKG